MREVEEIAVFKFLTVASGRCGRRGCGGVGPRTKSWVVSGGRYPESPFNGAPHAGNQIDDERQHDDGQGRRPDAEMFHFVIVRKADLPEEVEPEQREDDDPDGEVDFTVKDSQW